MIAPDFTLPCSLGKEIKLSDLKNQIVVLYFYPKDDTSGCTKEALDFNLLYEDFSKINAIILGVSPDTILKHQKFIEKYDLKFPLLSDTMKEIVALYGVWVEKSMYGKKYMGVERTTLLLDKNNK